jgi:predicted methyltransferase
LVIIKSERHKNFQSNIRLIPFAPIDKKNKLPAHFADRVLIFNSIHNWVSKNYMKQSFEFIHHVLKPGGVLGIVQHRIKEGEFNYPMSGYLTEQEVISLAQKAGFRLVDSSEINANLKDKANYPLGVWCLPPIYRMGNKERERFEEIGESDKMTLKFIKK